MKYNIFTIFLFFIFFFVLLDCSNICNIIFFIAGVGWIRRVGLEWRPSGVGLTQRVDLEWENE